MRRYAVAALILALGACAPAQRWSNPNLPESRWSVDKAECRSRASRLAERDLTLRSETTIAEGQSELQRQFSTFDAAKRRQGLYDRCLKDKGYTNRPPPTTTDKTS